MRTSGGTRISGPSAMLAANADVNPGGRAFYKLTGSGNDFIFFDTRTDPAGALATPEAIAALCARGTGIGADGVVFVEHGSTDGAEPGERPQATDLRIHYYNSDGSLASLCGNATLCTVRLASMLGLPRELAIATDAGIVNGRLRDDQPEIDLAPVRGLMPDARVARPAVAQRVGYAVAGVPHLVVLVPDVNAIDVVGLGAPLRRDPGVGAEGANVNFVSLGRWRVAEASMRTFERGVEAETLACGTGAVATAALLIAWGLALSPVLLRTRAGTTLTVHVEGRGGAPAPRLSGEGRLVFTGRLPG